MLNGRLSYDFYAPGEVGVSVELKLKGIFDLQTHSGAVIAAVVGRRERMECGNKRSPPVILDKNSLVGGLPDIIVITRTTPKRRGRIPKSSALCPSSEEGQSEDVSG